MDCGLNVFLLEIYFQHIFSLCFKHFMFLNTLYKPDCETASKAIFCRRILKFIESVFPFFIVTKSKFCYIWSQFRLKQINSAQTHLLLMYPGFWSGLEENARMLVCFGLFCE